jgi:hypothetical protein
MIYLANKTYELINKKLEEDQGMLWRHWMKQVLPHMEDVYRQNNDPFRTHLGASTIGADCARQLWYNFHWATRKNFDGRLLRLFARGHLEEARFIAMLLMIGCQVYQHDTNGKQFRISDAAGHYGGSGDGIAVGLPDLVPGQAALLEFKTHNDKSFIKLQKEGVKESKFEHYVQMNQYMGKFGLPVALYGSVNKNTDEIHLELVPFDRANYEEYLERGVKIVWLKTEPQRVNESPGWFQCSWCDHKRVCHGIGNTAPDRNCRTCKHSDPIDDGQNGGTWFCSRHNAPLTKEQQFIGCDKYERRF